MSEMLPAVGQGAIAIETRSDNEFAVQIASRLDHRETRLACLAERAFLRSLGGGCQFPIAAHAVLDGEVLKLDGLVARPDGSKSCVVLCRDPQTRHEELGAALAKNRVDPSVARTRY